MLQLEPSPPHTMHLSNFFLEPMTRSQPAWMQRPWTQTEELSGEQGVPSTTWRQEKGRHKGLLPSQEGVVSQARPIPHQGEAVGGTGRELGTSQGTISRMTTT